MEKDNIIQAKRDAECLMWAIPYEKLRCIYFMKKRFKQTILNIGTGKDRSIEQYAKIILNLILPDKKIKIN